MCSLCKSCRESGKKLDGVESISVNIATDKANIDYDPSKVKLSQIKAAIEKAGYKPIEEVRNKVDVDEDKLRKEREMKSLFVKFIVAIVFAVPLFYIAMGPMIIKPIGPWPLPEIINPMTNTFNYALIQLILVIPVMIAGYKFYINGFKSLFL